MHVRQVRPRALLAPIVVCALTLIALPAPAQAAKYVFRPAADANVNEASPARNYGASKTLLVDASPSAESFLRFNVRGVEGNVTQATLRLGTRNTTSGELKLRSVESRAWGERTVTYSSAPPVGSIVASSGPTSAGGLVSLDATALVAGEGIVDAALTTPATGTPRRLFSRESPAESPRLVVETDTPNDPVIAAAGDIVCSPEDSRYNGGNGVVAGCRQRWTADLLADGGLEAVLPLGDNQYELASLTEFQTAYDPTWGRFNAISHPVAGDREYDSGSADGYFDYFNGIGTSTGPVGARNQGYYSYDIGSWHLIALNSNCGFVPCGEGSAQNDWLEADLAANQSSCTLAYFHAPRFTSGHHGTNSDVEPLWEDLYAAGTDVILNGSDHAYERFARQDPSGEADPEAGIRQFIVGTGGHSHPPPPRSAAANSGIRNQTTFGVLNLTLHDGSYAWRFVPESIGSFTDTGSDSCIGPTIDTEPPSVPAGLTAKAPARNRVQLAWQRSTDNDGVAGYRVMRGGVEVGAVEGATSFVDRGLNGGTTYTYRVFAEDAVGNSSASSEPVTVTTPN